MFENVPAYLLLTMLAMVGLILVCFGIPSFFPSTAHGHTPKAVRLGTVRFVRKNNPLVPIFHYGGKFTQKVLKLHGKYKESRPKVTVKEGSKVKLIEAKPNTLNGLPVIYTKTALGYKLGDQEYNSAGELQFVTFCISAGHDPKTGESWYALHDAFMDEGALELQQGNSGKRGRK